MSQLPPTASRFAHQPLKILYTTFTIATLPIQIAFILIYYIPSFLRPNPYWTYHQAVGTKIFALWWNYASIVEFRTAKSLDAGREKDRFVIMDPAKPSTYCGILQRDESIRPVPIAGVWYETPPPPGEIPKMVVIHFHGGAYVLGGARDLESGWGHRNLSRQLKCPVLQPQYRLAVEKHACFPAAIQDGITAYAYVLNNLKVRPENIILSGDSAGGNLVIAILRYLSEHGKDVLPLPKAALLWSPWVNIGADAEIQSRHPNVATDYVCKPFLEFAQRRYIPSGLEGKHPYLSPLGTEFYTPVPIFVQTGTAEVLYDDNVLFVERMRENGCKVELVEVKDAPHDIFGAGLIVGFIKEAKDAVGRAVRFIARIEV